MQIRSAKQTQLSYKTGYAKSASESAYPELWDGLKHAWVPVITGCDTANLLFESKLRDIGPAKSHLVWRRGNVTLDPRGVAYGGTTNNEGYIAQGGVLPKTFNPSPRFCQVSLLYVNTLTGMSQFTSVGLTTWPSSNQRFLYRANSSGGRDIRALLKTSGVSFDHTTTLDLKEGLNVLAFQYDDEINVGQFYVNGEIVEQSGGTGAVTPWDQQMQFFGSSSSVYALTQANGRGQSVILYDRWLKRNELDTFRTDPLAPFRQRRYFPVSLQAEEPPTETATSGLIRLKSPRQSNEVNWDDPLNKGLVAWFPMRQDNGFDNIRDVSRSRLVAVSTGDLGTVAGPNGNLAYSLDAPSGDNWITVSGTADNPAFNPGTGSLSFGAWIRPEADGWFFHKGDAGSGKDWWGLRVAATTGVLQSRFDDGTSIIASDGSTTVDDGEWHFAFCTWDAIANALRVYVDGRLDGTSTSPSIGSVRSDLYGFGGTLRLGAAVNTSISSSYKGALSDVRIYDRALSAAEVHDLYVASRTGYRDQFKRRYFPVSLPAEEPPTETASTGLIRLKSPKRTQPSYKAGYAKSASESACPNLWDGLRAAYIPRLGETGLLHDVLGGPSATAEDGATWENSTGPVIRCDSADARFQAVRSDLPVLGSTWFARYRPTGSSSTRTIVSYQLSATESLKLFLNSTHADGGNLNLYFRSTIASGTNAGGYNQRASGWGRLGEWSWIAVTLPADMSSYLDASLYFDSGTPVSLTEQLSPPFARAGQVRIGSEGYTVNPSVDIGSVYVWDRVLSGEELAEIGNNPLAPFRQRRYAPVSLQPLTLLEKIRSVAKPTTTRAISLKKNSVPSYKSGYAKSASESAHPELWDGLVNAFAPRLGNTGEEFVESSNIGRNGPIGVGSSDIASAWSARGLEFDGTSNIYPYSVLKIPRKNDKRGTLFASYQQSSVAGAGIVGLINVSGRDNYIYISVRPDGRIRFEARAGSYPFIRETDAVVAVSGQWATVAGTQDGIGPRVYYNGVEHSASPVVTETKVGGWSDDIGWSLGESVNNRITIGAIRDTTPQGYLDGSIGVVLQYDRALSADEIALLHADPLAPFRKKTLTIGYQPNKELRGLFRT